MTKNSRRRFITILAAALSVPTAGRTDEGISIAGADGPSAEPSRVSHSGFLGLAEGLSALPLVRIEDAAIGARDQLAAMRAHNESGAQPIQNGFSRVLPEELVGEFRPLDPGEGPQLRSAAWLARASDGMVAWSSSVSVENAYRLRLELTRVQLPPGSRGWVWGAGESAPLSLPLDFVDENRTLWTPSVEGDTVYLEVQVPEEALQRGTPEALLRIGRVLQLFDVSPQGGSCLVDATCTTAGQFGPIANVRKAIAHIQYTVGSDGFVCTGGLLNDTVTATFVPYFLTANHCISTSSSASSLEAYFDYRSATCGGAWPNLGSLPRVNGSVLLSTSPQSDFSFLRLSSLPANRYLLGWTTDAVPNNSALHRVSHPFPDSFSVPGAQAYSRTTNKTSPDYTCNNEPGGPPWSNLTKFHYSEMASGGTYGGSSGSPVLNASGLVVGQLLGACGIDLEGCSAEHYTVDGRFSATFPSIDEWLDPVISGGPCVPGPTTLCIDNNPGDKRFKVEIVYDSVLNGGISGSGRAIALNGIGIPKGGLFWFFTSDNPEVMVKVINGCGSNGKFWLFYSAATTLGMTTTISDTIGSNPPVVIVNPDLNAAAPVATITAFNCP